MPWNDYSVVSFLHQSIPVTVGCATLPHRLWNDFYRLWNAFRPTWRLAPAMNRLPPAMKRFPPAINRLPPAMKRLSPAMKRFRAVPLHSPIMMYAAVPFNASCSLFLSSPRTKHFFVFCCFVAPIFAARSLCVVPALYETQCWAVARICSSRPCRRWTWTWRRCPSDSSAWHRCVQQYYTYQANNPRSNIGGK